MIRLLILRAWPALIPIALYLLWLAYRRRKAKNANEPLPTLLSGPWIATLCAALALFAASLFYLGLSAPKNAGVSYQPKQFKDGKLVEEEWQ